MFLGPICQTWLALSRIINLNEKDHHPESWENSPPPPLATSHSWQPPLVAEGHRTLVFQQLPQQVSESESSQVLAPGRWYKDSY